MTKEELTKSIDDLDVEIRMIEKEKEELNNKLLDMICPYTYGQIVEIPPEAYSHVSKICKISDRIVRMEYWNDGKVSYRVFGIVLKKDGSEGTGRVSWDGA